MGVTQRQVQKEVTGRLSGATAVEEDHRDTDRTDKRRMLTNTLILGSSGLIETVQCLPVAQTCDYMHIGQQEGLGLERSPLVAVVLSCRATQKGTDKHLTCP